MNFYIQVIHTFNIKVCYIPFHDVISLQSWGFSSCCGNKQLFLENGGGIGI